MLKRFQIFTYDLCGQNKGGMRDWNRQVDTVAEVNGVAWVDDYIEIVDTTTWEVLYEGPSRSPLPNWLTKLDAGSIDPAEVRTDFQRNLIVTDITRTSPLRRGDIVGGKLDSSVLKCVSDTIRRHNDGRAV